MSLADQYLLFLRDRLRSRVGDLQAALAPMVDNPPSRGCRVEIVIFLDGRLTGYPPLTVHAFDQNEAQRFDQAGVEASVARLEAMSPLLSEDEADRFCVWEGEEPDRMIALEQPIDGIDQELLVPWVAEAWRAMDTTRCHCRVTLLVHDHEAESEVVLVA